jgi:adenylosuccinate synthase
MRLIPGYEPYMVDEDGNVYGRKGTALRLHISDTGYLRAALWINNKLKLIKVHRALLLAYVGQPPNKNSQGRHRDGDRLNNELSNLQWGDNSDNVADAVEHKTHYNGRKLTESEVREIKFRLTTLEATKKYKGIVSAGTLSGIRSGAVYANVGPCPTNWFSSPGVYFIVDGAYGSTGKGAAAAWLYANSLSKPTLFTTNASPNAGHQFVWGGRKMTTRHLSVAGVIDKMEGGGGITYLNSGAIIDEGILAHEIAEFGMEGRVFISPKATKILPRHKENRPSLAAIASTQKGTGPAMADRLLRLPDVVFGGDNKLIPNFNKDVIMCEVPQGYSLGLHSGFYPHTTNRECTVMQAASDLGCSHKDIRKVMMTIRTYPIRVGNTADGHSGPCYPDQHETTWEELNRTPELTTVTKRVRRVFTFSWQQFADALTANKPDALWVGFMDYLSKEDGTLFIDRLINEYFAIMNELPELLVLNYGDKVEDAVIHEFTEDIR